MRHLRGFLRPGELELLRELAEDYTGYATNRGYTYAGVMKIPARMQLLFLRARDELCSRGARGRTDCFFLKYADGQRAPLHTDRDRIVRMIVLVNAAKAGGELIVSGEAANLQEGDAVIFAPTLEPHEVTPVQGTRLVWSVGICDY